MIDRADRRDPPDPRGTSSHGSRDPLDQLAEEYSDRRRRGEAPSISEYCRRRPDLADQIRDLFPTLELLERAATPRAPAVAAELAAPESLGEYRIIREIGRGGMGVVYEAEQATLGRRVALKLLPPRAVEDPRFAERFRLEAQAAAGLDHPGIVPVFGVGEADGLQYYVMQYIEGVGLDEVIVELRARREGAPSRPAGTIPLVAGIVDRWLGSGSSSESGSDLSAPLEAPPRPALSGGGIARGEGYVRAVARIGLRIAEALAAAHARGVLHRDVKPSNVLLDARGRTWITDFGLCKLEGSTDLTQSGALVGTLRYMAPERFEGRSEVQADIYGLGLILWELLALRAAFDLGDRAHLLGRIAHEGVQRLREAAPEVPADLELVVHRATARDPEERYPTADAFAQDLRAFLDGRPVAARAPSPGYLLRMVIRRNRSLAATIAISLLLAAAGGSFAIHRLDLAKERAESALGESERNATTARHRESIAHLAAAGAAIDSGDSTAARARLEQIPPEHRGWEWSHLRTRLDVSVRDYPQADGVPYDLCYARDGSRLLAAIQDRVRILSTGSGEVLSEIETHRDTVRSIDLDPSMRRIATGHLRGAVALWDATTGDLVREVRPGGGPTCYCVGLGPGVIAAGGEDLRVTIWPLDGGGAPVILPHSGAVWDIAFTRAGDRLVSACADGTVRLWDLDERRVIWERRDPTLRYESLSISPSEERLALGAVTAFLRIHDLASGELIAEAPGGHSTRVRFIGDDRVLTSSANVPDGDWLQLWDAGSCRRITRFRGHSRSIASLAIRPDGLRAASGSWDGSTKEWSLAATGEPGVLAGSLDDVGTPAWSPDGERIAAPGRDTTIRVWDARTGRPCRTLIGQVGWLFAAHFLDRSTLLAGSGGEVALWDLASATIRTRLPLPSGTRGVTALLPDRSALLLAEQNGMLVRIGLPDLVAGPPVKIHDAAVVAMAIDRRGLRLATAATDHRVRVWRLSPWELEREWQAGDDRITSLVFHPDGRRLVSTSYEQHLRVWDAGTGSEVATLASGDQGLLVHSEALSHAAFSPSGDRLAVGSHDGAVGLWDLESRRLVAMLRGHGGWVSGVAWSPDGSRLASGSSDGTVRIWPTGAATEGLEELERRWWIDVEAERHIALRLSAGEGPEGLAREVLADPELEPEVREARLGALHAARGTLDGTLDHAWELLTREDAAPSEHRIAAELVFGGRVRIGMNQRQSLLWGLALLRRGDPARAEEQFARASRMLPAQGHDHAAALGFLSILEERSGDRDGADRSAALCTESLRALDPASRARLEEILDRERRARW